MDDKTIEEWNHFLQHEILDIKEAAEYWNMKPVTVKWYCKEGRIYAKKVNNTWFVLKNQPHPQKKRRATSP